MAFVLTNKPREHVQAYTDGITLVFRELTSKEREEFNHELARMRNAKNFTSNLETLIAQAAQGLMIRWSGIEGEDGTPLECNDENKAAFLKDEEARKYWYGYINGYLWPSKVQPKGNEAEPTEEYTPDFLSSK